MEANNASGELFGVPRLSASLAANATGPISDIVNRIDSEVRTFAGTQPQADEMTAAIIRRIATGVV